MIGKLKGKITEIHGLEALIETSGGVFYRVFITPELQQKSGEDVEVYTYLNVKEDQLTLFGFETYEQFRMFEIFLGIDGVGPKTAFTIVTTADPKAIRKAVVESDVAFFQKIKGIGKKTAQRILVDMSAHLGTEFDVAATQQKAEEDEDAIQALIALGFKRKEAVNALKKVDSGLSVEDKIKFALQSISK